MFVDASALISLLTSEEDAPDLYARMEVYPRRVTSPMAVWETTLAVARRLKLEISDSEASVVRFLADFGIEILPIPADAYHTAVEAFSRYGKGRHPAGLNFGDCFAYACARDANVPMLYKGDDFARTDIEPE